MLPHWCAQNSQILHCCLMVHGFHCGIKPVYLLQRYTHTSRSHLVYLTALAINNFVHVPGRQTHWLCGWSDRVQINWGGEEEEQSRRVRQTVPGAVIKVHFLTSCWHRVQTDFLSSSVQVKNHIWVFVNALIENPSFDSQTKENMTLQTKSFGSKCPLSDKFIRAVRALSSPLPVLLTYHKSFLEPDCLSYLQATNCGIVESILNWVKFKAQTQLNKKCSSVKYSKIKGIPKLDDANDAGTVSACCLCSDMFVQLAHVNVRGCCQGANTRLSAHSSSLRATQPSLWLSPDWVSLDETDTEFFL